MVTRKPRIPCPYCGKNPKRPDTQYCSVACRAADWREKGIHYGGPKKVKTLPRACLECGKEYQPHNGKQKYCSKHCMGLARADEFAAYARSNTGPRNLSPETRRKMSLAASRRNASREYTKGIGGTRKDIGHYVRSRWEANIARVLKQCGLEYRYEPRTFVLTKPDGNPTTYTPDFRVNSWYLEVKGWWNERSKLKLQLMKEQYPEVKIYKVDEPVYVPFEQRYHGEIDGWERKERKRCEAG